MARVHTAAMLRVLVSVASSRKAQAGARVAAASAVLDRGWGKPQQDVNSKSEITVIVRTLLGEELPIKTIEHTSDNPNKVASHDEHNSASDKPKSKHHHTPLRKRIGKGLAG